MLQNIALSLAIITIVMPLALLDVRGLGAVVLVHELAEIVVIAHGAPLGASKVSPKPQTGSLSACAG